MIKIVRTKKGFCGIIDSMETRYLIERLASRYDSFYLYDEQSIVSQINLLQKNFPSIDFLYSVKCNPNQNILKSVFAKNFGASVSSVGEMELAKNLGLVREKIFYSAPGKSMEDLRSSYQDSVIVADSISEIERLKYLAKIVNEQIEIGVRINPNFNYEKDEGLPSRFGIDENEAISYLEKLDELYVKVVGIHTQIKNQELDCSKINRYYKKVFQLAEKIENALGRRLDFIDIGSGIGIPYADGDRDVNIQWLGSEMEERISNFKITHPKIRVLMTLGRFVVGKCGSYVTHVIDKKVSRGKTFVILQDCLNGFLRSAFYTLAKKYFPESVLAKVNTFEISTLAASEGLEKITLAGNSCVQEDLVAEEIEMPKLNIGDAVIFSNAGGYASVFSPMQFSQKKMPVQFFFTVDGEVRI